MKKYTKKQITDAKAIVAKYAPLIEKLLDGASADADKKNKEEEAKAKATNAQTIHFYIGGVTLSSEDKEFADACKWLNGALISGDVAGNDMLVESPDKKSMHYEFRGGATVGKYAPAILVKHTMTTYTEICLY